MKRNAAFATYLVVGYIYLSTATNKTDFYRNSSNDLHVSFTIFPDLQFLSNGGLEQILSLRAEVAA